MTVITFQVGANKDHEIELRGFDVAFGLSGLSAQAGLATDKGAADTTNGFVKKDGNAQARFTILVPKFICSVSI